MARHWHEIHLGKLDVERTDQHWQVQVQVYLGGITPEAVAIQLIADPQGEWPAECIDLSLCYPLEAAVNAYHYSGQLPNHRPIEHWSLRAIAHHPQARVPNENPLITWADD